MKIKHIFAAFFYLICLSVYAVEELQTLTRDGVLLKGVHLENEGGEPVLLVHGFMENTSTWDEVANALHARGHDVYIFNLRGHGNGPLKSLPAYGYSPLLNFDNIVAYDVEAIVGKVFDRTRKKLLYVGHSLGTMSGRLAMSGIGKNEFGAMEISQARVDWMGERIKGAVAITSPTTFDNGFLLGKMFKTSPDMALEIGMKALEMTVLDNESPRAANRGLIKGIQQKIRTKAVDTVANSFVIRMLMESIINPEMMRKDNMELSRVIQKGLSTAPKGLVADAKRWMNTTRFESLDGRIDYEYFPLPERFKYVFVAAEKDKLAVPSEIMRDFLNQDYRANQKFVYYRQHSHFDAVSGEKGGRQTAQIINLLANNDFNLDELVQLENYQMQVFDHMSNMGTLREKNCMELSQAFLR